MRAQWFSVGVSALALAACSATTAEPGSTQSTAITAPGVQAAADALVNGDGPPGVIVVLQAGDAVTQVAAGSSDLGSGAAMSGQLPFRIASVSKAYSGAVILSLVSQGKLAVTDRLPTVWSQTPRTWRRVTVGQLLQHTSGLPDYIKNPKFLKQFVANPQMQRTPQQLVDYVAGQRPEFKPGSQYSYSDTDNIVAGLIAEQVTGKPYADALADLVSAPLGLTTTELPESSSMPAPFIHGYAPVDTGAASPAVREDISDMINPQLAWASGGMTTTADELNTFFRGYAAGELFDATVLAEQRTFVPGAGGPPGPGTNSSGLGIYQYVTECGTFVGHTGNLPGYTTFVAASPDGANSVAVGVNAQITPKNDPAMFDKLLAVQNAALCAVSGR